MLQNIDEGCAMMCLWAVPPTFERLILSESSLASKELPASALDPDARCAWSSNEVIGNGCCLPVVVQENPRH